jgi:hypothetical protein
VSPTKQPTKTPTTKQPTRAPTKQPTKTPTKTPTTKQPTKAPTKAPTETPEPAGEVTIEASTCDSVEDLNSEENQIKFCNELGLLHVSQGGTCFWVWTCDDSSGRRLLAVKGTGVLYVSPDEVEEAEANVEENKQALEEAVAAAPGVEEVEEPVTPSTSLAPTKSPTPEPSLSWTSKYIFWIFLKQIFEQFFG